MSFVDRPRRIVLWLCVVLIVMWLGYSQYQDHLRREEHRIHEHLEVVEQMRRIVSLSVTHGARLNWPRELMGGDKLRMSSLTSLEVQQVWQRKAPLTFVGILRDVSKNDDGSYQVLVKYDQYAPFIIFSSTELYYSARCAAGVAAPLISLVHEKSRMSYFADAVVIGQVGSVTSNQASSRDGDDVIRIVGSGDCLAAMQLTKSVDWDEIPASSP